MERRGLVWWLAWALFAACLPLYALTVAFAAGYRFPPWDGALIAGFVVTPAVGALVASRQPRNVIGWLLLATGLGFGVAGVGNEYAVLSQRETLPLGAYAGLVASQGFFIILVSGAVLVPLFFPDGRLLTPRWRLAVVLAAIALLFGMVGFAIKPGKLDQDVQFTNPLGVDGAEWVLGVGFALLLAAALMAGLSLLLRFRRSRGEERQQLKWVAFIASLLMLTLATAGGTAFLRGQPVFAVELAFYTLLFFGLPASIGIAVLRYRLWDIDLVIQRSLVYGTLWLAIAGAYFGMALTLGLAASSQVPVWLAIGLTALATLVFQPARHTLERAADRWVFGRRQEPLKVVHDFGERLGGAELTGDIAGQLARATTAAAPLTWVRVEAAGSATVEVGHRRDELPVRLPLTYAEERLGELACQPLAGARLSDEDRATLAALCAQAAVAISRARLASRIVRAQEAERRRIERNIHDGAQQELVALVAKLGLARSQDGRLDHGRLLAELQDEVRSILINLRELAQGVHPSVLTDGGLVVAVEDRCSRLPLPVDLDIAPELRGRRLDEDIEAAAYYLVAEGLTNLLRHSGATSASVSLQLNGAHLSVVVADDGAGFDVRRPQGGGLLGLADRLQALGGDFNVESGPGRGTKLCARLPVQATAPA